MLASSDCEDIVLAGKNGLGRRSDVADRRQCDKHTQSERETGGPGSLERSVALRFWSRLCRRQLRRTHENAACRLVLLRPARDRPGRARRRLGTKAWQQMDARRLFLAIQRSKCPNWPSMAPEAVGLPRV